MGKWFADEKDRIKKEKDKILTQVAQAQHKAKEEVIKKEYDEEARANAAEAARSHADAIDAGSHHPVRDARIAGAASAARNADKRAGRAENPYIKEADKNTKDVIGDAKHELNEIDKEITEHYKELYHFAMTALEKSPQDEHISSPSENTKKKSRLKK